MEHDPVCGMTVDPPRARATPAPSGNEWTCPMHPEIVRAEPGTCPICGMALEPRTATAADENPELADMTRRFGASLVLTLPLLVEAMAGMLPGVRVPHGRGLAWVELA